MEQNRFGVLDFLPWDHDWNGHHYSSETARRSVKLMRDAGVGTVRIDFLWSDLEPRPGEFDFAKFDRLVDLLTEHNLKILGLLNYNPLWRSGPWNAAPDPEAYKRYAVAVVRHFKSIVRDWEIWNEPDHPDYWHPQDHLAAYSQLLKSVYAMIKQEDPGSRVLAGGLSQSWPQNLRLLYEKAGAGCFDVVNIHPFVNPLSVNPLEAIRRTYQEIVAVMTQFGDAQKPIWFTEVGCPGVSSSRTIPPWWLGANPSEEQQAEWVRTLYPEVLRWKNVEKIFWAFFRDTQNHFKTGTDFLGLIRHDLSPKPGYDALRLVIKLSTTP